MISQVIFGMIKNDKLNLLHELGNFPNAHFSAGPRAFLESRILFISKYVYFLIKVNNYFSFAKEYLN